jgi:DNA polymerase epsilon subunit 1
MKWKWRGQMLAARKSDYVTVRNQLQAEKFPPSCEGGPQRNYDQLKEDEKESYLKKRLQAYSQSVYKRIHEPPMTETRNASVCMRENPFYVNTVRDFRNRRYEYKGKVKEWKKKYDAAKETGSALKQKVRCLHLSFLSLQRR